MRSKSYISSSDCFTFILDIGRFKVVRPFTKCLGLGPSLCWALVHASLTLSLQVAYLGFGSSPFQSVCLNKMKDKRNIDLKGNLMVLYSSGRLLGMSIKLHINYKYPKTKPGENGYKIINIININHGLKCRYQNCRETSHFPPSYLILYTVQIIYYR